MRDAGINDNAMPVPSTAGRSGGGGSRGCTEVCDVLMPHTWGADLFSSFIPRFEPDNFLGKGGVVIGDLPVQGISTQYVSQEVGYFVFWELPISKPRIPPW